MIENGAADDEVGMEMEEIQQFEPNILTVKYHKITRNMHGELHTIKQNKNYRFAYQKGVILKDFSVQPFGFKLQ